jgi:hypothetical protein
LGPFIVRADAHVCQEGIAQSDRFGSAAAGYRIVMLILGIILLILGFILGIPVLWTIGIILALIGAVLWVLGAFDHPIAGRRHYW